MCLDTGLGHPYLVETQLTLLWSINERLAGKQGLTLPPLNSNYIDDIEAVVTMRAERQA